MTLDWAELARLSAGERQSALLDALGTVMGGLTAGQEDAALARLPPPLRVLWLLDWLEFEVAQGSLLAYFANSHGRHAAPAAAALREIGAAGMADVLDRARETVAALHPPPGGAVEHGVRRPYAGWPPAEELTELTRRFDAAAEADDWGARLDAYLHQAVLALAYDQEGR